MPQKEGIVHQLTVPNSAFQNGKAERMNKTIKELSTCLMLEGDLSPSLWAEACNATTFLLNRTTRSEKACSPLEMLSGEKPNFDQLRMYGSTVFAKILDQKNGSFDPRSKKCKLIGYSEVSKAYRLMDLETGRLFVSRDVKFVEKLGDWNFEHLESLIPALFVEDTADDEIDSDNEMLIRPKESSFAKPGASTAASSKFEAN